MKTNRKALANIMAGEIQGMMMGEVDGLVILDYIENKLKEEFKRGARKACPCKERKWTGVLGIITADKDFVGTLDCCTPITQLPPVHISDTRCVPPQPEPQRYTREEATTLADAFYKASYWHFDEASDDNAVKMYDARRAVIDAIAGQPKPAQFDADIVKGLIGNLMGSVYYKATINDWLTESQKRAAEIVENDKRELYKALGIE